MCLRVCCYVLFSKYMYADFHNQQRNTLLHMHTRRQVIFTAKETENAFLKFFFLLKHHHISSVIYFHTEVHTHCFNSLLNIQHSSLNTLCLILDVSFTISPSRKSYCSPYYNTHTLSLSPFTLQLNIH